MTKRNVYRQCGLRRELGNDRSAHMVTYLPIQFAKPRQVVRLKDANDQWEDGWEVLTIGESVDYEHCCLLYTSPSPRDQRGSRMPSSA